MIPYTPLLLTDNKKVFILLLVGNIFIICLSHPTSEIPRYGIRCPVNMYFILTAVKVRHKTQRRTIRLQRKPLHKRFYILN